MMNYDEYRRKKEQLDRRKEQMKNQIVMIDKSLNQLKLDRMKVRMDKLKG